MSVKPEENREGNIAAKGAGPASDPLVALLCDPSLDAEQIAVEAGAPIYEADDAARNLYFVRSGQVRIFLPGREASTRLVEILGAGDWFGVAALADAVAYGARAVAVTPVSICRVSVHRLMARLPMMPEAAAELIRQISRKLIAARLDAANLVFEDTHQRLVNTLLLFSKTAAATPQEGGEVVLRITHQQLAQAVGAARETVSLTLTQLRQQKVLRTGRNRLWFSPVALEEFARHRRAEAASASAQAGRQKGAVASAVPETPTLESAD